MFFVHTEKGAALLEGVRDLVLTETEFEHASRANPILFRSKAKSPQREVFAEVFADKGLAAACRRSKTMKQRVLSVAGKWCPGWVKKGGGEEYYGEGDSRTISPYTNSSFFQLLFLAYSSVCSLGVFEDFLIQNTNKKRISNNLHVQNYSISKSNIGTWFCLAS